ncbi:hypothetical protein ABZ864_05400 [Streptomyces sp. NPDC047082]|uniref:hypothetical protein n=1 Tax=Streptomyces sp. NPDC047082 TaxID=3155259 RepID=UPI00292E921A|nr:hypothetical protein [Streptomyces sp. NEAU-HV9]
MDKRTGRLGQQITEQQPARRGHSRRMHLQLLDLHGLDHLELISAQVQAQLP